MIIIDSLVRRQCCRCIFADGEGLAGEVFFLPSASAGGVALGAARRVLFFSRLAISIDPVHCQSKRSSGAATSVDCIDICVSVLPPD